MVPTLRFRQGHMSVGDGAEGSSRSTSPREREKLPVLSCGLPSRPLKTMFFASWERIESVCLSFLHSHPQMRLKQKPDRRPSQNTGRRVSAVHQGGTEPLTSSPRSEFTTLSFISFNEVSMWRTRNCAESNSPRFAWEFLRPMLANIIARNHFPRDSGRFEKKHHQLGSISDRSGKVWLVS